MSADDFDDDFGDFESSSAAPAFEADWSSVPPSGSEDNHIIVKNSSGDVIKAPVASFSIADGNLNQEEICKRAKSVTHSVLEELWHFQTSDSPPSSAVPTFPVMPAVPSEIDDDALLTFLWAESSIIKNLKSATSKSVSPVLAGTESEVYVSDFRPFLVITGAGVSTESGIPDYRSEGVGLYATSKNRPIQYQDFITKADYRQRYWARNYVAWPRFSSALPNFSHTLLRQWQESGFISWLITQNVDNLHFKAGSRQLTELHGNSSRIRCLQCDFRTDRHAFQKYIASLNIGWLAETDALAPDGDVQISQDAAKKFNTPHCPKCGGIVKPDVVFFGENVAKPIVDLCFKKVDECKALLVIGSSLETYSAFRFIKTAYDQRKPILLINIGKTRGDKLCDVKVESRCSDALAAINGYFLQK